MQSSTQSSTSVIPITQTSATQAQRQVSQSSTLSESIDSAEGGVVLSSRETATLYMVNDFLDRVMEIWNDSASLENLRSKRELALQWTGYVPTILLANHPSCINILLSISSCVDILCVDILRSLVLTLFVVVKDRTSRSQSAIILHPQQE
jgi:hypothetical protein